MAFSRSLVRSWLVLGATIGGFLLVQPFLIYIGFVSWANHLTAQMLAGLLRLLGAGGSAEGAYVRSEFFSLEIVAECTAILPIVIFLGAVWATPATTRSRWSAVLMGVPAIVLFNLVRLVSLIYIGYLAPRWIETVHLLVWQPLVILFSVGLWLWWAERWRTAL
ncbi:MAG: archaeosortase/exosortase family protein [Candidatus Bipolaricaulota bacterium]|nr:archaeosortase/exosortase family protein [Candidatus Bipolaricaulota bacterium]MCS7273876.1 archaeosortase/exosortase family protein [Candidatus Bipolaricaulota bacterium]MDW8110706.1 archaeosortase/exosortase family protein [Candidatus Bipolaricaulota bacterium]MDW8328436.1 archaeosortase/exosortase family protein [Candidatus Bipolaricaulota bacterium]